jgi:hypothetical protein
VRALFKILTFSLLLGFLGCEKKRYPDNITENGTIFFFEGIVDGVKKKISAGIDNYYMYASYIDNGGILQFNADLKRTDCENCSGIRLLLNDSHLSSPGSGLSDSSLKVKSYAYARENSKDYDVKFQPFFNRSAKSYHWDFGDGVVSSESAPLHKYNAPGKYNVCLTIESTTGCYSQICNEIDLSETPFRTQITAQQISANTILFSHDSLMGKAPFRYYWSFGDGSVSTDPSVLHPYAVNGSYPVILMVTDADGNTITCHYNTLTGNDASSCAANFRLGTVSSVPSSSFLEADIKWRDEQGREYHSSKVDQPSDSFFEVIKVEEFERNENNEPTKKLTVTFNCVVSDGTRNIKIQDATAVISVAYPQ